MRILVYGAGSLGSLLGGMLAKEHLVALLGRKEHVDAVQKNGLKIEGLKEEAMDLLAISSLYDLDWEPDLVLLTVKSYDTASACQDLLSLEPVPVIGIQNGLGNLEIMKSTLWDEENAYAATTSMGARKTRPGVVQYTGEGVTRIPTPSEYDAFFFDALVETLENEGVAIDRVENVVGALWEKAAVNLGINYLTAIEGRGNSLLVDDWKDLEDTVRRALSEMVSIARKEGINLDLEACVNSVQTVASNTSANRSSMLQDLDKGRRTENQSLAGYLLKRAEEHEIDAPAIQKLYDQIELKERGNG